MQVDNFNKVNGHVIPAMISKFIDAKVKNSKTVKLLGTGRPIREFIHSNDLSEAILTCLKLSKSRVKKIPPIMNAKGFPLAKSRFLFLSLCIPTPAARMLKTKDKSERLLGLFCLSFI